MKIKIQNPEFGSFDRLGNFEMHLFEVIDGQLVHSTGTGVEHTRRAVVAPAHVRAYTIQCAEARRAKIAVLK